MFADHASSAGKSVIARISSFLGYWGDALISVLPQSLQDKLVVGEEQLIVSVQSDRIEIIQHINSQYIQLGAFERQAEYFDNDVISLLKSHVNSDSDLVLQVADETVLSKPLDFPLSVANHLNQTVSYELEKHTPFDKSAVYFDTKIMRQTDELVFAQLFILHHSQVQTLIQAFSDAGVVFDRLCTQSDTDINLLPEPQRRKKSLFRWNKNWLLSAICLLLLLVIFAVPALFLRHTAISLNHEVEALKGRAEGEPLLWEQRDDVEQVISDFLASRPVPFATIYEELSKQLPDDTWVNDFSYGNGVIRIKGESADAAALIARINASPLFTNGQILSPIVRSRQSDKDRFYIGFDVIQAD